MGNKKNFFECRLCLKCIRSDKKCKHKCDDINKPTFRRLQPAEAQEKLKIQEQINRIYRCEDCKFKAHKKETMKKHYCKVDKTCPICFENTNFERSVETSCRHYFCKTCFQQWLRRDTSCASCRSNITHYRYIEEGEIKQKQILRQRRQRVSSNYLSVQDAVVRN